MKNMSEIFGIKILHEGAFLINFKIIYQYEHKYSSLKVKLKCKSYKRGYFNTVENAILDIISCKNK